MHICPLYANMHTLFFFSHTVWHIFRITNSSKTFWTAGYDRLIIIFLTGNMFSPVLFKQAYLFDQSLQSEIWTG